MSDLGKEVCMKIQFCEEYHSESHFSGTIGTGTTSMKMRTCEFIDKKSIKNGESAMSLCLAQSTKDALYLAADSRSSVGFGDVKVNGKFLKYHIKSDNYVKLACVKILNTEVAMYSTGDNCFCNNKTFVDCLDEINLEGTTSVKEGIQTICDYFSNQSVSNLHISFFYFENGYVYEYGAYDKSSSKDCNFSPERLSEEKYNGFYSGTDWGQALAKRMIFSSDYTDEMAVCTINQLYEDIQQIAAYFDNTIGGTIRIAKLTPKGFTWLQGEPT